MLKKNDFIELDYTGYTSDGVVFDTTKSDVALKNNLKGGNYTPLVVCIGRRHILPGLDSKLEGLSLGNHIINLSVNEGFGPKDPKQLKLMPMKLFQKQQIRPFVGLELNIDDRLGVVRNISGGRVIVDFNHPLSGKELKYEVEIKKVVEDKKVQIEGLMRVLSIPYKEVKVTENKGVITSVMDMPKQLVDIINKEAKEVIGLELVFETEKKVETKEKV